MHLTFNCLILTRAIWIFLFQVYQYYVVYKYKTKKVIFSRKKNRTHTVTKYMKGGGSSLNRNIHFKN